MNRASLRPWLDHLKALPFVQRVELVEAATEAADGGLILHTPHGRQEYEFELKTTRSLGYAGLEPLLARARAQPGRRRWLLLASYVSRSLGAHLRASQLDFVDASGNCHLDAADRYFASVEGRKVTAERPPSLRVRSGGMQVLFVLAADPALVALPVRELARLAGTGKSATAAVIARLIDEGLIVETATGRRVVRSQDLVERWISTYPDLRRRWVQGRYRAHESDPEALERKVADAMPATSWAWGGTAASVRMLGHYRGAETILHVNEPVPDLPRQLRAIPDRAGPLTILITPPPLAFAGAQAHVVHPLLVYAELLVSTDERARNTATRLRERYLGERS